MKNNTEMSDFILLGLTKAPGLQVLLFMMFTFIYAFTLVGNLGMILLILLDAHLHTPMYFFLSNLSLVDFGASSTVTPKVMAGLLTGRNVISYNGCAVQMFFFVFFATVDSYLLASMAYDRYAAVCKPLHYTTTMTKGVCTYLAVISYTLGILNASMQTGDTFSLPFCVYNVINHFFCDIPAVRILACSDKHINEMILILVSSFHIIFAFLVILISYLLIFLNILKMHSSEGYQKAFSTCASHLTAVFTFYGTVTIIYLKPSASHSMDTDKFVSVFYTMVIPMLNPMVYSLRNKEVKNALKKVVQKAKLCVYAVP
ncbi:olfactory receptor 5B2-like [Rattus norvegicus]|uniref:olfactory receptor 5B2-like n=1 Tax=Rattus norvegicus TaxID=10116 RepID=UPI0001CF3EA9|nr:olfactory receptor 5B2-like [Rattus norvegicus]|eukprot:XP_003749125.1 PREDICTED: olfactory receptor 5B2-like [Rattus norvegicus]